MEQFLNGKGHSSEARMYPEVQLHKELDSLIDNLFDMMADSSSGVQNIGFTYQFNTMLYRPLMESCVFELLNEGKTSFSDDSDDDDDDSFDSDDIGSGEFHGLLKALRSTRHYLSISKPMESLCLIDATFELFRTCDDYNTSDNLEKLLLYQIHKFYDTGEDGM